MSEDKVKQFTEILENIPEDQKEFVEQSMMMATFMQNAPESAISKKLTEEHISTYLKVSGEDMRLSHKGETQNRILLFAIILIMAVLFCFVVLIFRDSPDVLEKILFTSGGVIIGAIGGFGFGKSRNQ